MERSDRTAGEDDPPPWTTAGIRDYWLGGWNYTAVERKLADSILVGTPQLPYIVRVYRALLRRVVRSLVNVGVRQFLDLGSGLPTQGNVHQVAQATDPACRVVYVDNDPQVVLRSQALLTGTDQVGMICADLRQTEQVLAAATQAGLLDLSTPVALLLIDILHHIPEADNPAGLIQTYVNALSQGSYVAIAHTGRDRADLETGFVIFRQLYHRRLVPPLTFRDPVQIADLLQGLKIVEPGIVPLPLWRPAPDEDLGLDPEHFPAWCGVGQKS